jgi:hypothetical protein
MKKINKISQKIKKNKQEKNKDKKKLKKANIANFFELKADVGSDDSDDYGASHKNGVKKN